MDSSLAFADLVLALREVQDLVAGSDPPPEVAEAATATLRELSRRIRPFEVAERDAPAGKLHDQPGRGHSLLLPFVIESASDTRVRGRVRFTRFYLGGNGAAHGGAVPLLFDEVLGHLCNVGGRSAARTAYLRVDYRAITPIGPELVIDATIDREEGRKRWLSGRLHHGDTLLAEAEGLFVALRPGQP